MNRFSADLPPLPIPTSPLTDTSDSLKLEHAVAPAAVPLAPMPKPAAVQESTPRVPEQQPERIPPASFARCAVPPRVPMARGPHVHTLPQGDVRYLYASP